MKMINCILTFVILSMGCKKPVIIHDTETTVNQNIEDTTWVKKIWQVVFDSSSNMSMGTFAPVQYQDQILFGDKFNPNFEPIKSANIFTGKYNWVNTTRCENHLVERGAEIVNNKFVYCRNWNELGVIDLNTGQTLWTYCNPSGKLGYPGISIFNDILFNTYSTNNRNNWFVQTSKINSLTIRDVYHCSIDSGFIQHLDEPSGYIAPNGDTLIIGCSRKWMAVAPGITQADVYCQNITTGQLMWMHKNYDPAKSGSFQPPVIEGNIAYVLGAGNLTAIDILTGNILFQKIYAAGRFSWLKVINGEFYMHISEGSERFYKINPINGNIHWQSGFLDYETSKPVLYKNYIVSGGRGGVYFINKDSGELVYTLKTSNDWPYASYKDGVVIDPVNKLLFCTDSRYFMCYKIKF